MIELLLFSAVVLLIIRHRFFWRARIRIPPPKFMAHRGIKIQSPENSISAYQEAVEHGFNAIELDVVSTKDGQLMCSHNFDLERETNGNGWMYQKSFQDLAGVKSGFYSHPENTQPIPTFIETLAEIPRNIFLNIEIKTTRLLDFSTARLLKNLIKDNKIKHPFMVSSFNPIVVAFFRLFCPGVSIGFICQDLEWVWISHWIHPDCFHLRADLVTQSMLQISDRHQLPLNVWTVNTEPAIRWCLKNKLSSIITDNPKAIHV
jgi:glycerophosphoryl diester phosphodiesterase